MPDGNYVVVRVTCKKSQRYGRTAKWFPDKERTDKQKQVWHLLEFYDGFRCWFPRDEFEEVHKS